MSIHHLVIVPLVAFLPAPLAYRLALLHGDWRYRWDAHKGEEVMRCLEGALGDQLSPAQQARVALDIFRRSACQSIESEYS